LKRYQPRTEAIRAIVCFNEIYEIHLKSPKYAEALEIGTIPVSSLASQSVSRQPIIRFSLIG
jgi:hypothetical protein